MAMTYTVSSPMKKPERISRSLGVYAGKITIDSYSSSIVECTAITRYFVTSGVSGFEKGIMSVQVGGPSSNGYICTYDYTSGGFKCYAPTQGVTVNSTIAGVALNWTSASGNVVHGTSAVGTLLAQTASEAAANADIGDLTFVAVGFVKA